MNKTIVCFGPDGHGITLTGVAFTYCLFSLIGLFGNFMVIYAVLRDSALRKNGLYINVFILALVDFFCLWIILLAAFDITCGWPFGNNWDLCFSVNIIIGFYWTAPSFLLVAMSSHQVIQILIHSSQGKSLSCLGSFSIGFLVCMTSLGLGLPHALQSVIDENSLWAYHCYYHWPKQFSWTSPHMLYAFICLLFPACFLFGLLFVLITIGFYKRDIDNKQFEIARHMFVLDCHQMILQVAGTLSLVVNFRPSENGLVGWVQFDAGWLVVASRLGGAVRPYFVLALSPCIQMSLKCTLRSLTKDTTLTPQRETPNSHEVTGEPRIQVQHTVLNEPDCTIVQEEDTGPATTTFLA